MPGSEGGREARRGREGEKERREGGLPRKGEKGERQGGEGGREGVPFFRGVACVLITARRRSRRSATRSRGL